MREGIELIKKFEGFRSKAYLCPAGIPTIGYGETKGVKLGMTITEPEAANLLESRYDEFEKAVKSMVKVQISPNQLGALTSFAYNLGASALKNSSLLKALNQRNYKAAADGLLKWVRGGGKVLPGLTLRRKAERELFLSK